MFDELLDLPPLTHFFAVILTFLSTCTILYLLNLRGMPSMSKLVGLHIFLQIFALYICFLTFLRPAEAVVERGIAYVDNHDDKFVGGLKERGVEKRDHEWHKRASGEGVIEVRAEKVGEAAQVEERDQHATGGETDDSNNDYTWGTRMERANAQGEDTNDSGWGKRGDAHATGEEPDDSHEWNKRGDMHATSDGPDDSHDWLKREEAVNKPNDSHDWLMKRSSIGPFHKSKPFPPSGVKLKLDKRGMIEEWLNPRGMERRQLTCRNPGYVPCSNSPYCCPSQSNCCSQGCKNDASDVCCNGYSCDAGYQCKFSLPSSEAPAEPPALQGGGHSILFLSPHITSVQEADDKQ